MKKSALLIAILFGSFQIGICVQHKPETLVKVWKVKVNIRLNQFGTKDILSGEVIKTFTYYIKDSLILQRDTIENPHNKQTTDSLQRKGNKLVSTFSVKIAQPVYLINLGSNVIFTFCRDSSISYVAYDSLKNHFDDLFYKHIALDTFKGKFVVQKNPGDTQSINGHSTYRAYSINKEKISFPMLLSRNTFPFTAPLNAYFPELKETIMNFCATDDKLMPMQLCYSIEEVAMEVVEKRLFELPPDFVIKKDVPYNKIIKDLIDPFK